MALDLLTVARETSLIFDRPPPREDSIQVGRTEKDKAESLLVPEPPIIWKDKMIALEKAKLDSQRSACIYDMRRWQASEMGFKEIQSNDLVKMLMKEAHTETGEGERQNYEWAYDHHTHELLGKDWGGPTTTYKRVVRKGLWYLPPFAKVTVWECIFGKLDHLKREIPYGVVLRINEVKQLNLFNCFNVLAPKEAWTVKTDIDPIVVATIWELPPQTDPKKGRSAGQAAHYFLAQW